MGGVIRGDDGHDIWLNIDRRAFRMSLCTIQMLHLMHRLLLNYQTIFYAVTQT